MKILKSLMLLSFLSASCFAKDIKLTENENKFSITTNSITGFDFVNQLSEINTSKIKKNDFQFIKLSVDGYGENADNGFASLPVLEQLINIPQGATININPNKEKAYGLAVNQNKFGWSKEDIEQDFKATLKGGLEEKIH